MTLRSPLVALSLLLLAACAETPVDPAKVPASIVAVDGLTQNGTVGAAVGTTPTFEVRNADGAPLAGVRVTITVTSGGGTLTGKPSASGAGATAIGTWTLGTDAGTQTVTVSRSGLASLVFTATAAPGAATGIVISSGNNQSALAGVAVANPVRASVVDQFGNGIAGAAVNWAIGAGGGSLTGSTSTVADGTGLASAPSWTLGKGGGTQQLVASSGVFQAVATANILTTLVAELRWVGTAPTGSTLNAFTRAVDRIRATIVGGMTPVGMPAGFNNVNQCDPNMSQAIPSQVIQGVIIYAAVVPIDGAGNILGSAGPCLSRDTDMYKTALGVMRFDSADIANMVTNGTIDAVILHEMLHVMGVGTSWSLNNLLLNPSSAGNALDTRFTGTLARAACANVNGGTTTCATSVPVHNTDGAGSINAHWRESVFGTELMTPFISAGGGANQMSAMTIQSLADLGYNVNLNTQETFSIPNLMASAIAEGGSAASGGSGAMLRLPEPTTPVFLVDRAGRLIRLRDPR